MADKCETKYCRRRKQKGKFCFRCANRRYKKKHPFRYFFNKARGNAKQRGHEWHLTFAQYKSVWEDHPKAWKEKIHSNGTRTWTLDRIRNEEPYQQGNIQVIPLVANVLKYHRGDKFVVEKSWHKRYKIPSDVLEKAPF